MRCEYHAFGLLLCCCTGCQPLHQSRINCKCDFALIILCFQQRRLIGIGEKTAFRHDHRVLAVIAEKQFFAASLDLAAVGRLKHLELRLHDLRKAFAAVICVREKHLRAAVLRIGKLILMNRNTDGAVRLIQNRKAVIHIRAFLIRDAFNAFVMDGSVGVARDMYFIAGDFEQRAQIEQDIQVDSLFRYAVRR